MSKQSWNSFTDNMLQFQNQFDFSKQSLPKTRYQIHFHLKWLSFWNLDGSNMYVPASDNCIFYVIKWCRVKKKEENNHIECKCSNDNCMVLDSDVSTIY